MTADNANGNDPTIFSAVLTPHRSLGPTGFTALMAAVAVVSFAAGVLFLMMGAWPVFGFFGLDAALIYFAFRANYRGADVSEHVRVTATELKVRKVDRHGEAAEWTLNPLWVRLEREADQDFGVQALHLVSRGRKLTLGSFLAPSERASFAEALSRAIAEAKRGPTVTVFGRESL